MKFRFLSDLLYRLIEPTSVELDREPDHVLDDARTGEVYLQRWWLIPRNCFFNLYLHRFCSSDPAEEFHDHPWGNLSIVLDGSYREHILTGDRVDTFTRHAGDFVFRRGKTTHRIDLMKFKGRVGSTPFEGELPCWTLFVTGPRLRKWGFRDVATGTWTPWKAYGDRNSSKS